jgi:hypothetical protein
MVSNRMFGIQSSYCLHTIEASVFRLEASVFRLCRREFVDKPDLNK